MNIDQHNNNNDGNDNNANNNTSLDYYDSIDITSDENNSKNIKGRYRCSCQFRNKHSLKKRNIIIY